MNFSLASWLLNYPEVWLNRFGFATKSAKNAKRGGLGPWPLPIGFVFFALFVAILFDPDSALDRWPEFHPGFLASELIEALASSLAPRAENGLAFSAAPR